MATMPRVKPVTKIEHLRGNPKLSWGIFAGVVVITAVFMLVLWLAHPWTSNKKPAEAIHNVPVTAESRNIAQHYRTSIGTITALNVSNIAMRPAGSTNTMRFSTTAKTIYTKSALYSVADRSDLSTGMLISVVYDNSNNELISVAYDF